MDNESIRKLPREDRIDIVRREYTAKVLEKWVNLHFAPDDWCVYLPQYGGDYSPRQALAAVKDGAPLGKDLAKFLFDSSKRFKIPVATFIERAIIANQGYLSD